jgi:hypothetical protein
VSSASPAVAAVVSVVPDILFPYTITTFKEHILHSQSQQSQESRWHHQAAVSTDHEDSDNTVIDTNKASVTGQGVGEHVEKNREKDKYIQMTSEELLHTLSSYPITPSPSSSLSHLQQQQHGGTTSTVPPPALPLPLSPGHRHWQQPTQQTQWKSSILKGTDSIPLDKNIQIITLNHSSALVLLDAVTTTHTGESTASATAEQEAAFINKIDHIIQSSAFLSTPSRLKVNIRENMRLLGTMLQDPLRSMLSAMTERFKTFIDPFLHYPSTMTAEYINANIDQVADVRVRHTGRRQTDRKVGIIKTACYSYNLLIILTISFRRRKKIRKR